jgi:hypothetical protein
MKKIHAGNGRMIVIEGVKNDGMATSRVSRAMIGHTKREREGGARRSLVAASTNTAEVGTGGVIAVKAGRDLRDKSPGAK